MAPRIVYTFLNYYNDPGDGSPPEPVVVGSNTVTNMRSTIASLVTVRDITGHEDEYTLDTHGFQLLHHESRSRCVSDGFHDPALIKTDYFPEVAQLLKDATGAIHVRVFDHKVRRGPAGWHGLGAGNAARRGPLHRVHVDQSYAGAELLARRLLAPADADALLLQRQRRWQIINVWRPIATVRRDPLAVADARSVAEGDLVAARTVYADHESETWTVRPGFGHHRWFFKDRQEPWHVWLIKCFDSEEEEAVARRTPHAAFLDALAEGGARESVEVRAMLFY